MRRLMTMAALVIGANAVAMAALTAPAPEIDANSATSAVALLSGALVVLRSRRRR